MSFLLAENHFEIVTKGSYRKADHLGHHHIHKLTAQQSDPVIAAIKADFSVHLNNWDGAYVPWLDAENKQIGATEAKNLMLADLRAVKSKAWMVSVFNIYPEGSPRALELMPHRREALISGSIDDIIAGLKAFIKAIGTDTNLATVLTDAQNFLTSFEAVIEQQEVAKGNLKFFSAGMEALRIELTTALFASQGALINKFASNPKKIDTFFDVHAMWKTKKEEEALVDTKLTPSEIALMDMRYTGTETILFTNNGKHDAAVFFSETSSVTTVPADRILIQPGETVEVDLKTISSDKRFLFAANLSSVDDAELVSKLK